MSWTRTTGGFALALAVLLPASLVAQDTAAPNKVGVFNPDRVIAESAQGQQAIAQLDQLQNQRVAELQQRQADLNALQQRVLTAPPDSSAVLQRQYQDMQIRMQRMQEDVQNELQQRQAQLTEPIIRSISGIIDRIGADEGFTMIFNALQSGLVYVDESIDLTDRIIEELNAQSAGTGGS